MGSIYRMPFLIVDDAVGFVKGLKARKICTYAAHLHGVHSYREEDYTKGTAFLIGNEGNGLTDAMAEAAECLIRIPMEGKVVEKGGQKHEKTPVRALWHDSGLLLDGIRGTDGVCQRLSS